MEKLKTVGRVFLPVLLGGLVGFMIGGRMDYAVINKPLFSPPGILFPIVWTILYLLIGVSYAILKGADSTDVSDTKLYYFGLFVNLLWPIFFFYLKWRLFSCLKGKSFSDL